MSVAHGRVLRGVFPVEAGAPSPSPGPPAGGRRVARVELEAHARAKAIVLDAERAATHVAERAAREAREAEHAKLAAQYLLLRAAEERSSEREMDRAIKLGVLLAERLLGATIAQDPTHIAALAREALVEARGVRRATIEAHPLDAVALRGHVSGIGLPTGSVEVVENPELSRGSLLLHTDLGTLDAQLTPQLERLAKALRHALEQP